MLLEVKNVHSGYGKVEILHGLSLNARQKETTLLIGPNGSGKSTLLKTIMGTVHLTSGEITFEGKRITGSKPSEMLKNGVQYVPQGRTVFKFLSVEENLKMGAWILRGNHKVIQERIEEVYDGIPILRKRKSQPAGTLSGGEQTMLCIGRSLMLNPKLIMIDEPSLGLAPKVMKVIYEKITEIKEEGRTVILVEQNVRKGLSVADHVYVLDLGKIRFEGSPKDVLMEDEIVKVYLGAGSVGGEEH